MYHELNIDKLRNYTPEGLERCAFGLFVSDCFGFDFDNKDEPNSRAVLKAAERIAKCILDYIYPIPHDVLWKKSDEVIKWAAGVSDQADEIILAVLKCDYITFNYKHPLIYVIGDRQLETSKKIIHECEKWIEEMDD